jgi:hypothetical protein
MTMEGDTEQTLMAEGPRKSAKADEERRRRKERQREGNRVSFVKEKDKRERE